MEDPKVGQNAMPHFPEVTESYPIVPACTPAAVGSDGGTSVEGVAGTPPTQFLTILTPTRAAAVAMDTAGNSVRPVMAATSGDYGWDTDGVSAVIFNPPDLSDDPEAVARPKGNEIKNARLAMIPMLHYYVQALVTSEGSSAAYGRVADKLADCFNPSGLSDDPETVTVLKGNEIKHTRFGQATDKLIDKSGVPRTEIDNAEKGQAIVQTATSQDIKYAFCTSALLNAGNAGEVMDITETTDENENAREEYPGDYGTMENYYDPEHHDIWGDSEDGQRYQKAPRASVNADSMNPKQAAQLLMYNTVPTNFEGAPPVIESNYSDPLIKDTCGSASYHVADARRSDG